MRRNRRSSGPGRREPRHDPIQSHRELRQAQAAARRSRQVPKTPITSLEFGHVLHAHVEYREDRRRYKPAPVVILAHRRGEVLVLRGTTQLRNSPHYPLLRDWDEAGLAEPTAVNVSPFWLPTAELLTQIGELSASDRRRIQALLGPNRTEGDDGALVSVER